MIGEWIHFDLRCYTCDGDVLMADRFDSSKVRTWGHDGLLMYCSPECGKAGVPLSREIVVVFRRLLETRGVRWYLEKVGALAVADAMLDGEVPKAQRADGIRSYQWRVRLIEQVENWIRIPVEVAA